MPLPFGNSCPKLRTPSNRPPGAHAAPAERVWLRYRAATSCGSASAHLPSNQPTGGLFGSPVGQLPASHRLQVGYGWRRSYFAARSVTSHNGGKAQRQHFRRDPFPMGDPFAAAGALAPLSRSYLLRIRLVADSSPPPLVPYRALYDVTGPAYALRGLRATADQQESRQTAIQAPVGR